MHSRRPIFAMRPTAVIRTTAARAGRGGARAALLAATVLAGVVACSDTSTTAPGSRSAVVRAYLYAGQPVSDIRLTYTAPIGTPDSLAELASPPINTADVALIRNGVRYVLTKSPGDSGYYRYAGADLVVKEGDVFDFEARVDGQTITARTTVPVRPSGARVSSPTLTVPTFAQGPGGGPPNVAASTVQVRWNRVSDALFFVTLENTETSPTAIDLGLPGGFGNGLRVRRIVFPPTSADSVPVSLFSLSYLGRHTVRVWRVNDEYAQLYATLQQDSRDLNEPATNIHGGLGVFSAFAADTTVLTVVK